MDDANRPDMILSASKGMVYAKCTRPSLFLLRGCGTQTRYGLGCTVSGERKREREREREREERERERERVLMFKAHSDSKLICKRSYLWVANTIKSKFRPLLILLNVSFSSGTFPG